MAGERYLILNLRLKDRLGPVTRVKKKKKKRYRMRTNISMSAHVGLSPQNHPDADPASFASRIPANLVQGSGCRVQGTGCRVRGAGFRVQGAGLKVQGSGCRAPGGATNECTNLHEPRH